MSRDAGEHRGRAPRSDVVGSVRAVTVEPHSISPVLLVGLLPAAIAASVVAANGVAHVFDRATPLIVSALALLCGAVVAVLTFGVARRAEPRQHRVRAGRLSREEVYLLVLLLIAAAFGASRAFGFHLFSPTTYSVDVGHHGAIASWIVDNREVPRSAGGGLDPVSAYPTGPHMIAALLSIASGLTPLTTIWLVALVAIFGQWPLVVSLCRSVSPNRHAVGSLTAVTALLLVPRYSLGIATFDFFYPQLVSIWLAVAGVAWVVATSDRFTARTWLPTATLLAVGAGLAYPQQGAIVPVAVAGCFATGLRRSQLTRRNLVVGVLGVFGAVVAARAVLVHSTWRAFLRSVQGTAEGAVARGTIGDLGGRLMLILSMIGLLVLFRRVLRRHRPSAALAGAALVPVCLYLVLLAGQRGFGWHLTITSYRVNKNLYAAVPFGAACVGVAADAVVAGWRRIGRNAAMALAAVALLAVATRPRPLAGVSTEIATQDAYGLARWARLHVDPNSIGIAGPGLEPYTIGFTALHRPVGKGYLAGDIDPALGLIELSRRWDAWPADKSSEEYLLVDGRDLVARYLSRPGSSVVRRQGTAALFRRDSARRQTGEPSALGSPEQGATGLP